MYACPEGLDPRGATVIEKRLAKSLNIKWEGEAPSAHPMYDYRKVPTKKLMQRLDVLMFKDEGPLKELNINPARVRIPLDQHIGTPARALVNTGDYVKKYDLIAESAGKISSNIHASLNGKVKKVTPAEIIIQRN